VGTSDAVVAWVRESRVEEQLEPDREVDP